jgi:hypothetical protein
MIGFVHSGMEQNTWTPARLFHFLINPASNQADLTPAFWGI